MMPTPSPADETPPPESIYYTGKIASINHDSGELVIMGYRDDRDEEGVFKFKVEDPGEVYVSKDPHFPEDPEPIYDFEELQVGFSINVDCYIKDDRLVIDAISVLGRSSRS